MREAGGGAVPAARPGAGAGAGAGGGGRAAPRDASRFRFAAAVGKFEERQ